MIDMDDMNTKQKNMIYKIGYESLWVLIGLVFIQGLMKALNIAFCTGSTGNLIIVFIITNYFGIRRIMLNCYSAEENMIKERKIITIAAPLATIFTIVLLMFYRFSFVGVDGDANVVVLALVGTISAWIAMFIMWRKKQEKR